MPKAQAKNKHKVIKSRVQVRRDLRAEYNVGLVIRLQEMCLITAEHFRPVVLLQTVVVDYYRV